MSEKDLIIGFVFDLDGTLINSTDIRKKIEKELFRRFNIKTSDKLEEEIEDLIYKIMDNTQRKNLGIRVMWAIFKKLGLSFRNRLKALIMASKIFKEEIENIKLFDGTLEMFEFLDIKSSPYTIATTSSKKEVDDRLKEKYPQLYLKLNGRIITRDDVKHLKPSPDQIELASNIMKLSFNRMAMVGDMHTDIIMGKTVGAITIGVLTGIFSKEKILRYEPDFIINSVADIPTIYEKIKEKIR